MRVVITVAWAGLWHRPARWLLVVLGVAAATLLPVQSQATAATVTSQALRYGLAALAPGDRSLAITRYSLLLTPPTISGLDTTARTALAKLSDQPVRAIMLTARMADLAVTGFHFGAADDLGDLVHVTDGRLPTSCTPTRCEVVQLGDGELSLDPALGLVVVGHAVRTDDFAFTGQFDDGAPILVAAGVTAGAQLTALAATQRSYAWIAPLDLDRVAALGVDGYLAASRAVSDGLYGDRLVLTAPDGVLREQAARAALSTRRFALIGGAGMALLLGFAAIGAIGLRREHAATVDLLRRRGARGGHVALLVVIGAAVPVLVATLLGLAVGLAWLGPAAARAALPTVAVGGLAAAIVVGLTVSVRRPAWRAMETVIVAGIVVAAVALARGAVTAGALDQQADPLLLVLPVLAVLCGGLLVGRLWPVVVAGLARLVPRRVLSARIGLPAALRSPLRPVATTAFLAAATGVVAFAGAYQATLAQGAAEQAAFQVPLAATVTEGPDLNQPLAVATANQFAATGGEVHGVVRSTATAHVDAATAITPQLLGLDPAALALFPRWDDLVGGLSASSVRAALGTASALPGLAVPAGTTTVTIAAAGSVADLDLNGWVRLPDGRDLGFPLLLDGSTLTGTLAQPAPAGSIFFAMTVAEAEFESTRRQHREGEGGFSAGALTGTMTLGPPAFDGVASTGFAGWESPGATVTAASGDAASGAMTVDYGLQGDRIVLRAGGVDAPIPVVVDPTTASTAVDGILTLLGPTTESFQARVVGVVPRFPTTQKLFAVADATTLANVLDRRFPGTGSVGELWLSGSPALDDPVFASLRVASQQSIKDSLDADPVARGAGRLLLAGALVGLAVALLALVLQVVADRRDEAATLYAWESDGVAPATLRRSLFTRALAVVAVGVPGGVLVAVALTSLTVSLVRVTALGTEPHPPLSLAISPLWSVLVAVVGIVVALLAGLAVAASALREPLPPRPEEAL